MRLNRFSIENYRGIREASLESMSDLSLILITGRNGTGKSLILEALTAIWNQSINLPEFVGPYGHSLTIELSISLTDNEYHQIDEWREARSLPPVERSSEHVLEAVSTNRDETGMYVQQDEVLETLQNKLFTREHPFASIDLLSARRQVSLTTTTSVDLSMLDRSVSAEQRRAMYEEEVRWKSAMQMPDIGSYLMSLDYRDYVAGRGGSEPTGDYAKLQEIFKRATGKDISLPIYDPVTTNSSIRVSLPSGEHHPLEDLSNGERELLGMLYYVNQLSVLGGVLLLDEPEKHLHPTLQLAALNAMMQISGRGQIIVVTHSPGLIASAPTDTVFTVKAAWESDDGQLLPVGDPDNFAELFSDLGLARRDLLQSRYLLLVEGADDEKRLRMVLPEEVSGAKVVVAGGRDGVLRAADALQKIEVETPWLAIIDRDFMTPAQVRGAEQNPNVFVWHYRMLENMLITTELLYRLLAPRAGTKDSFCETLGKIVQRQKPHAIDQFVSARVKEITPEDTRDTSQSESLDRVERQLMHERDLWTYRLKEYRRVRSTVAEELDTSWDDSWQRYINGKAVFAEIQKAFPVFRSAQMLIESAMVYIRSKPESMPSELLRLKSRLNALLEPSVAKSAHEFEDFAERDARVEAEIARVGAPDPNLNFADSGQFGQ